MNERRRNGRAENCRVCGAWCEAGAGWLYRDTHGRSNRYTGRFGWFVKCDKCHTGNETRLTLKAAHEAENRRANPAPRPWSVTTVRTWHVERTIGNDGDAAIVVVAPRFREVVSYRESITGAFCAASSAALESRLFTGRPLSAAALADLEARILPLEMAVNREERDGRDKAAALLAAAGAVLGRECGGGLHVTWRGREWWLYGAPSGHVLSSGGAADGKEPTPWTTTTAEELLATSEKTPA